MEGEVLDNLVRTGLLTLRGSGSTLSSRVQTWLNRAQNKIARRDPYDLLANISTASTTIGQASYQFPTDIRSLYTMRVENGLQSVKLILVQPQRFDYLVPKPNEITTNMPRYYIPYKTRDCFELFPIPDAVYTLRMRYSAWPTAFTDDTSVSDYTKLDDVIIYYATMYGFMWLQELKDSRFWQVRGDEALQEAGNPERDAYPDWTPIAQGFSTNPASPIGDYYNDPFIKENP